MQTCSQRKPAIGLDGPTSKDDGPCDPNDTSAEPTSGKDRSFRLYSKKHRVYVLREFLLETYGDYLTAGDVVLDIAGGKGDLSWLLHNVDDLQSVVVDPRRTINHIDKSVAYLRMRPEECRKRAMAGLHTYQPIAALMPQLEAKDFRMQTPAHLRIFVDEDLVQALEEAVAVVAVNATASVNKEQDCIMAKWGDYWERASRKTVGFITPTGKNDFSVDMEGDAASSENSIADARSALDLILRARLIVGFHPDQATDYCFKLAEILQVPVCVVPCCVFPSEFPHRRLFDEDADDERAVERYDDLIPYLLQENKNVRTATLAFPGTTTARRIAIYKLPSPKRVDDCDDRVG